MARLYLPEPAVVVGHSMGSQVAQHLAIHRPDRVRGLVLIGGFTTLWDNPAIEELWHAVADLPDPVAPDFVRAFQESTLARPVPAAFLDMVVRESLKLPARIWRAALAGQMAADTGTDLARIAVPTLLLWGDRDAVVPHAMQQALLRGIPGARLKVLPGAGHAPHWEDPVGVAAEIAGLVAATGARRHPAAATAAW
jgi:non-heme chloroperoxidase